MEKISKTKYGESFYRMLLENEGKQIGKFQILSFSEFVENENIYKGKIVIVGTLYIGMGHFIALCYVPTTDNFVFCSEGGSNGYDRDDKYDAIMDNSYTPHSFPVAEINDDIIDDIKTYNKSIFEFTNNKKQYTYDGIMKLLGNVVYDI